MEGTKLPFLFYSILFYSPYFVQEPSFPSYATEYDRLKWVRLHASILLKAEKISLRRWITQFSVSCVTRFGPISSTHFIMRWGITKWLILSRQRLYKIDSCGLSSRISYVRVKDKKVDVYPSFLPFFVSLIFPFLSFPIYGSPLSCFRHSSSIVIAIVNYRPYTTAPSISNKMNIWCKANKTIWVSKRKTSTPCPEKRKPIVFSE